jgi:hypothetical protein
MIEFGLKWYEMCSCVIIKIFWERCWEQREICNCSLRQSFLFPNESNGRLLPEGGKNIITITITIIIIHCNRWKLFLVTTKPFLTCEGIHTPYTTLRFVHNEQEPSGRNCMLGWPCVTNCMYNNQHDALFIFGLLIYHTSTCFGRISSRSSGGRMYIRGKWCLLYCTVDCQRAWPIDS